MTEYCELTESLKPSLFWGRWAYICPLDPEKKCPYEKSTTLNWELNSTRICPRGGEIKQSGLLREITTTETVTKQQNQL